MGIVRYKPTAEPHQKPNLPTIEPENFKSIVYSDDNVPLHSIIGYIEGSHWTVDYYSQIVSEHNDLREIDPGQAAIYQQYQKIVNLELRVNTPLSSGYDSSTALTTATGAATIYPFMVPNINDYFITDSADNKKALFKINNVERKTFNRDSSFTVEYSMVGYVDTIQGMVNSLNEKTNRTFFFYKDRLTDGLHPFVTESVSNNLKKSKRVIDEIIKYYFTNFFNRKYYTLLVPGQDISIYDNYLVSFILKLVNTTEALEITNIRELPEDFDAFQNEKTLLDCLIERNVNLLRNVNKRMGVINKARLVSSGYLHGFRYTAVDYLIYPTEPDNSLTVENNPTIISNELGKFTPTTNFNSNNSVYEQFYVKNGVSYQLMYPVDNETGYILSNNFYTNNSNMSVIEILIKDYLNYNSIDIDMLFFLIKDYQIWNRMEQFYYLPLIILLLKHINKEGV